MKVVKRRKSHILMKKYQQINDYYPYCCHCEQRRTLTTITINMKTSVAVAMSGECSLWLVL